MSRNKVYVKFPKVGLGNMLLIWARAYVFAKKNNLELGHSSWSSIRWGTWLRNDFKKRFYWKYFKEENLLKKIRFVLYNFFYKKKMVQEIDYKPNSDRTLFIFKTLITNGDYFKDLKPYRDCIITAIYDMLEPRVYKRFNNYNIPEIGVHIRRGDFKNGSTITPLNYFKSAIESIRKVLNQNLAVTVFSDASDIELQPLLQLKNVLRAEKKEDILDILLLSKSKICILSISSTFSFWGAFLSNGIILKHPEEWHPGIRPAAINKLYYEGYFDSSEPVDPILKKYILQINDETHI